jgi:hypothetical protein
MEELTDLIQTLWRDEMISSHAYAELLIFTNTHKSNQFTKIDVCDQNEQICAGNCGMNYCNTNGCVDKKRIHCVPKPL